MKKCSKCKISKPTTDFNKHLNRRDKLQTRCRECQNQANRKYYTTHKSYFANKIQIRNAQYKQKLRAFIFDYYSTHPCVDCGESDPMVLEFDHRDRNLKTLNISNMVSRSYSISTIMREIEKCEVRCANCHRRKTAKEDGWYRQILNDKHDNDQNSSVA